MLCITASEIRYIFQLQMQRTSHHAAIPTLGPRDWTVNFAVLYYVTCHVVSAKQKKTSRRASMQWREMCGFSITFAVEFSNS